MVFDINIRILLTWLTRIDWFLPRYEVGDEKRCNRFRLQCTKEPKTKLVADLSLSEICVNKYY